MDWEPTSQPFYDPRPPALRVDSADEWPSPPLPARELHRAQWDGFAVGKQRMWGQRPGEDETGLEGLMATWGLTEEQRQAQAGQRAGGSGGGGGLGGLWRSWTSK